MELNDIKDCWLKVARRAQSVAKTTGISVVTIRVLCDSNGNAIWSEPKLTKLEPGATAHETLLEIIEELTEDG